MDDIIDGKKADTFNPQIKCLKDYGIINTEIIDDKNGLLGVIRIELHDPPKSRLRAEAIRVLGYT